MDLQTQNLREWSKMNHENPLNALHYYIGVPVVVDLSKIVLLTQT